MIIMGIDAGDIVALDFRGWKCPQWHWASSKEILYNIQVKQEHATD